MLLDDLPFALRTTIRSVVLMASNSPGAIEALEIFSISSDFIPDGVLVADRHPWGLVS